MFVEYIIYLYYTKRLEILPNATVSETNEHMSLDFHTWKPAKNHELAYLLEVFIKI